MANSYQAELPNFFHHPEILLQRLIQFDTTNPPGNEVSCISYINELLTKAGIDTTILARTPERPNLIARLRGQGQRPPVLLYGHVDVVSTEHQQWQHPPFEGIIDDGFVWGRGALDMKGGISMMLAAVLHAQAKGMKPPGDVILAVLSDEEAGGDFGAKFLVEEHSQLFNNVKYALGEFGGFTMTVGGRRFYPIMVAEKQICWMKATIRGPGGHGSMPIHGGAMSKLSNFLQQLDKRRLPVHVTPVVRAMIEGMAAELPAPTALVMRQLLNPALTNNILDLLGSRGKTFDPLFHNTVSPTIVRGGDKINVIPSEINLELDGRLLPGFTPQDMLSELQQIAGDDIEFEIQRYDPGMLEPDMSQFNTLAEIICQADPLGTPVPLLLSGVTDGRFFNHLGIQTYGFLPMQLPDEFNFTQTIHAADERIPIAALTFGAKAIYQAIQELGNT